MTEQYIEELIRKYADGKATTQEVQQLHDWYRSFEITEVPWPSSDPSEKEIVSQRMLDRLQREMALQKAPVVRIRWTKIAAAVIALAGLAAILLYLFPTRTEYITINNPSGQIQRVTLPDSSTAWLNASTTLRYAKSFEAHRELILEGEAYFEVTHDPSHPFRVDAGGVQTTVLGTRFNIKGYSSRNSTTVSLISGKVKITESKNDIAMLDPSTQLLYNRTNKLAQTLPLDTNSVQAWRQGKLQFQGESFAEIANALENWYGVNIIFSNPSMQNCRYYMTFDNKMPLNKLLAAMTEITDITFVFDNPRKVILSGKGCE